MREAIEKKLGYTIEEYFNRIREKKEYERRMNWETEEEREDFPNLTVSELFFLAEYARDMQLA